MPNLNHLFDLDAAPAGQPPVAAYGASFANMLCAMPTLTDEGHAACPEDWRALTALLHTLIEDEGMTTEMAAWEAAVPVGLVRAYRRAAGI